MMSQTYIQTDRSATSVSRSACGCGCALKSGGLSKQWRPTAKQFQRLSVKSNWCTRQTLLAATVCVDITTVQAYKKPLFFGYCKPDGELSKNSRWRALPEANRGWGIPPPLHSGTSQVWCVIVKVVFLTRKPSYRWQTRATRKHTKIAPIRRAYQLQRCRWQYWRIFIRLAVVASEICEIPRNSLKIQTYRVQGHPRSSILVSMALFDAP